VVGDDVAEHAEPVIVGLLDQAARVVERAEAGIDRAVVGHVIAAVHHR